MRYTLFLATLLTVFSATVASATASPHCYSKPGTISKGGRPQLIVWHDKVAIYSCRLEYVNRKLVAKKRRLGPWKAGTKVSYDGNSGFVAWATPRSMVYGGPQIDRIWARSAWRTAPPLLAGRRATPPMPDTPSADTKVVKLVVAMGRIVWVTREGGIYVTSTSKYNADLTLNPGLPNPLPTRNGVARLGSYSTADAAALAASLKLEDVPNSGDGDECGGAAEMTISFTEPGTGTALSARGSYDYTNWNCN